MPLYIKHRPSVMVPPHHTPLPHSPHCSTFIPAMSSSAVGYKFLIQDEPSPDIKVSGQYLYLVGRCCLAETVGLLCVLVCKYTCVCVCVSRRGGLKQSTLKVVKKKVTRKPTHSTHTYIHVINGSARFL